ncbi:MAG: GlmU family protein [Bacteroidota bacterium]
MHVTFVDTDLRWQQMLPLTYTRPIADLRIGILKIHEKWQKRLAIESVSYRTQTYLSTLFPASEDSGLHLLGGLLPSDELVHLLNDLKPDEAIVCKGQLIAGHFSPEESFEVAGRKMLEIEEISMIEFPWDIFRLNGAEIREDYKLLTEGRVGNTLNDPNTITYGDDIFLEENVSIKAAIINAESGPVYLGKGSQVAEGAVIKGPFAMCEKSVVNISAKIKGDTTIGPYCKVGGEVSNAVFQGYSNKGHDGFLGNSVIGEWCNLGADTNNSNLKNNYANVKMWDFASNRFKDTGLQFCGLIMGDHSKCGINTMFNTGTTVGVFANIFGTGFPRNFIPSFAWGGASGFTTYQTKKAFETADLVFRRRNRSLTEMDKNMLSHIFTSTTSYRSWEKSS